MNVGRRAILVVAMVLGLLGPVTSADAARKPIVYVVVIDGLDGDAVEAGRAPFIASLIAGERARTTYFPRSRSVLPARTNPNHAAMMTGAFPGSSGIAANSFAIYAPLAGPDSCRATGPFDYRGPPTETSGESPGCLQAETVFEAVRRQAGKRRPITAAIMGKPKLGRIFDARFRGRRAVDHLWAPCIDETSADDSYCASPGSGGAVSDSFVMDEVLRTMRGVPALGRMRRPRFTFVNLPRVDSAGHTFGRGEKYNAAVERADREIARLVKTLRVRREWRRTVLLLVSDHSMDTTPEKVSLRAALTGAGVPSDEFRVFEGGSSAFVYLADRAAPRGSRWELLKRMRAAAIGVPGIGAALYRRKNPRDGGRRHLATRAKPRWHVGPRTGDLIVTTRPGWEFGNPGPPDGPPEGDHGGPHTADTLMAVTGGWRPIRRRPRFIGSGGRSRPSNASIGPTVMRLFGLRPPRNSAARALHGAFRQGALGRR